MVDWLALLPAVVSLFAVVDPLAAAPIYLGLTEDCTPRQRMRIALKACLVGLGVLLLFGLAGEGIFHAFGITIPGFRVAGGLLLLKYAFDMLHGERPGQDGRPHEIEAASRDEVAITPLGVPLLTGPGAIVTFMVYLAGAPDAPTRFALYGAAIGIFALTLVILLSAAKLDRVLSPSARIVTIRLMGLLLAAIAIEFIAEGALGLVDAWQASRA